MTSAIFVLKPNWGYYEFINLRVHWTMFSPEGLLMLKKFRNFSVLKKSWNSPCTKGRKSHKRQRNIFQTCLQTCACTCTCPRSKWSGAVHRPGWCLENNWNRSAEADLQTQDFKNEKLNSCDAHVITKCILQTVHSTHSPRPVLHHQLPDLYVYKESKLVLTSKCIIFCSGLL